MKGTELLGKVGSLKSRLLEDEDYEDLLRSSSVPEIAQKLSRMGYEEFIPKIEEIHRRDLEAGISRRYYSTLGRLKKYLTFPRKKIIETMEIRCEIETVKKMMRVFVAGDEFDERFLGCDLPFEVSNLMNSSDMEDFVSKLSSRPYHSILSSSLRSLVSGTGRLENSLDFWYFKTIYSLIKKYGTRKILNFLRKQADLMNSLWIYRGRVIFDLEPGEVMGGILPFGFHLKPEDLKKLSQMNREDLENEIWKIPIFKYRVSTEIPTTFLLERIGERYMYIEAKRLSESFDGFEAMIGYIHLLEYEVRNITTVIESVRYSLEPSVAMPYLIRG